MQQEIQTPLDDELRDEYDETVLTDGVRGKYLARIAAGTNLVRLAPDVAAAFPTEAAVNEALRLLLKATALTVQPTTISPSSTSTTQQ
ncbi:hypothetical protein [Candidatus Viridilinea mediisalina]|uniref:Uncharacterized protein n=1 Tax=Candidatus Viridilinea mediisalina TaxID=2024553 RepID=A0A2A6RQ65_9CHLR|nr:hypothetical protein [Candidatus Viridilinea mediisalina]PDW05038.1 hypothetical protein CJ255_00155 [Candidatus Viridilinea mediisalina]